MAYTGTSIVDYLKSIGKPTDFASRTQLAKQAGISHYTGTPTQNTQLLNSLRTSTSQTPQTQTQTQPNYPTLSGQDTGISYDQNTRTFSNPPSPQAPPVSDTVYSPQTIPFNINSSTDKAYYYMAPGAGSPTGYIEHNGTYYKVDSNVMAGLGGMRPSNLSSPPGSRTLDTSQNPPENPIPEQPGGNPTVPTTGNPQYDETLKHINDFINEMKARGQAINPNVQITPDKLKEFTTLAEAAIHPYYASQAKVATDSFLKNLGYSSQNLQDQEKQAQVTYAEQLKQIGESSADKGFAQSGGRQLNEQNLATNTQNSLDQNRRQLQFNAGNEAGKFAQTYGVPNFQTPTLGANPRVLAGQSQFDTSGAPSGMYSLSPDVYNGLISSQQNEEKGAVGTTARQLATDYTTQQANQQTRTLNQPYQ